MPLHRRFLLLTLALSAAVAVLLGLGHPFVRAQTQPLATLDDFSNDYTNRIAPLLAAASDCAGENAAFQQASGWAQQAQQTLGQDDLAQLQPQFDYIQSYFVTTLTTCYNEAAAKCVSNHDPTQALEMQRLLRQLTLALPAGATPPVDAGKIARCLTFELDFDSTLTVVQAAYHIHAIVPISIAPDTNIGTGTGPLTYVSYPPGPAGSPVIVMGSTAAVTKLSLDLTRLQSSGDPGISLTFSLGTPSDCLAPLAGSPTCLDLTVFAFTLLHDDEVVTGSRFSCDIDVSTWSSQFAINGWTYVGTDVLARKSYSRTTTQPYCNGPSSEESFAELTTFALKHTPAP